MDMGWMDVRVNAETQLEAQDGLRRARSHSRPPSKALASNHVNVNTFDTYLINPPSLSKDERYILSSSLEDSTSAC